MKKMYVYLISITSKRKRSMGHKIQSLVVTYYEIIIL